MTPNQRKPFSGILIGRGSRHLLLILFGTMAGALSSIFFLPLVIRGAVIGFGLSLGIVVINRSSRIDLDAGRPPSLPGILAVAVLLGICIGLFLTAGRLLILLPEPGVPELATAQGWPAVSIAVLYSVLLHFVYFLRWRFSTIYSRGPFILFISLCAGLLCGAVRAGDLQTSVMVTSDDILFCSLWGGGAFAVLWTMTMMILDPAWSLERWRNC